MGSHGFANDARDRTVKENDMFFIPAGLVFVFFYFNITLTDMNLLGLSSSEMVVDVLPDIVGYGLIAWNAWRLRDKSYSFSRLVWLCAVMGVFSLALQLVAPTGLPSLVCVVLQTAGMLGTLKLLNMGVADLEKVEKRHLNLNVLERWRKMVQLTYMALVACLVAEQFLFLGIFSLLILVLWFFMCLFYVITFLRTAIRYKRMDDEHTGKAKQKAKLKNRKYLAAPLEPHIEKKKK